MFASDPEKWADASRFVRSALLDQHGQFEMKGLPAGEYLAVAVDYVQDRSWNDPEYLESIRRSAEKISLADGETRTVTLKLVTP